MTYEKFSIHKDEFRNVSICQMSNNMMMGLMFESGAAAVVAASKQRLLGGSLFSIYMNETSSSRQANAGGNYVDEVS